MSADDEGLRNLRQLFEDFESRKIQLKRVPTKYLSVHSKEVRAKLGLSQEDFAERYPLAISDIRAVESGRYDGPGKGMTAYRLALDMIESDPAVLAVYKARANVREPPAGHSDDLYDLLGLELHGDRISLKKS